MFFHSFISETPVKDPSHENRENIRSPSTEHHANGRPTYNGVQPGFLRKIKFYSVTYWGEKPQRKLFSQMKEVSSFPTVKVDHLT